MGLLALARERHPDLGDILSVSEPQPKEPNESASAVASKGLNETAELHDVVELVFIAIHLVYEVSTV
jgi:hypothetical protein